MKNNKKEFFNMLAEKLEEQFPKGECKERGQALVLNSWANVLFDRYIAQAQQSLLDEVERDIDKYAKKMKGIFPFPTHQEEVIDDIKSIISQKRKELEWSLKIT